MVVPIKSSSNQVSLTLQTNLINPTPGTYSFSARFFSDSILFSTTNSYNKTIYNNTYSSGMLSQVSLMNVPRGAGTSAFYTFKIPAMSIAGTSPDSLTIDFPTNFINNLGEKVQVAVVQSTDATLLSKLTYLNLNQIMSNTTNALNLYQRYATTVGVNTMDAVVTIGGLGAMLKQVNTSMWLYYIVGGVLNPSKYVNQTFKLVYSEGQTVNSVADWVINTPLVYYISVPPSYMLIDSLTVSDTDTLVPAIYKIQLASNTPILTPGKSLAVIVLLPNFYNSTFYADTNVGCWLSPFSGSRYNCSLYGNELVTLINTTSTTSLSTLNITIDSIYNPPNDTYCNTTDIGMLERTYFRVKVLDLSTNQILMETSAAVDARTCLAFTSYRIPISVSYYSTMQSGLISTMNYSISQVTNSMKLTPYCSNLGITFNPKTIDFNSYNTTTVMNSIVIRSDVTPGSYWINYTKSESTVKTYYKPLLPILINVVTGNNSNSSANATVTALFNTYSYVGYPIVVPIVLSVPSSTPLTLTLSIK